MSRTRLVVLLGLTLGIGLWMVLRPSPKATAAATEQPVAAYGENTEEVALHRWQNNESRHWRQAVTRH